MTKQQSGGTAKISFNKSVYKPGAVKRAVKDYSAYAYFALKHDGNYLNVEISGVPADELDELKGEFCNYTLVLMKEF